MQTEESNVIQQTDDYSIFRKLKGNRYIRQALVEDLMRSFTQKPLLRQARPILLNEHMEVIDGQALAVALMLKNPKYDHKRMLNNLGDMQLTHRSSRADYLRDLEVIYNKNSAIGNHVRFL